MEEVQYSLYEKRRTKIPTPQSDEKNKSLKKILLITVSVLFLIGSVFTVIKLWPKKPEIKIILGTNGEVILDGESAGTGTEFSLKNLEKGLHTITAKSTDKIPFLLDETEEYCDLHKSTIIEHLCRS